MFTKLLLPCKVNIFDELTSSSQFENVVSGRMGAVLLDVRTELIPIVRTTTKYTNPAQPFASIHYDIIDKIREATQNKSLQFNNALVEIYNSHYTIMGYHSDQALDLEKDSFICVFSCYQNPTGKGIRTLKVKNKETNTFFDVAMEHNSIILFSIDDNKKHQHKIILEQSKENNVWCGVTFRLSKTFIKFVDTVPCLHPIGKPLRIATKEEETIFYKQRSEENKTIDFDYPEIGYTISESDLMDVKSVGGR